MTAFIYFLGFIVCLIGGGYTVTRRWDQTPMTALTKKTSDIKELTAQYNAAIAKLEKEYNQSSSHFGWNLNQSYSRRQYSKQYQVLAQEYNSKRRQMLTAWEQMHPTWSKARHAWGIIFWIGIVVAFVFCAASLPIEEHPNAPVVSTTGEKYWNAETIPIPYLKDANQYVSNPDNILTQNTVDQMNKTLKQLEKELDIQSVVIVVNHIENDDPFRMAQDVGNKYGVGRNDRGLMVVVGYLDHSINISPGRSLEGDLTDAECHRLQQRYVVPAMRAEMPDSGMLYLTEAIYATMKKKALPDMSSLTTKSDDIDNEIATIIGMYVFFFIAWCVFFLRLNSKYQWLAFLIATIRPNPFHESSGGNGFYGGGGSFGGGGGFSGGSFGGGSFGGGGATSRW